MTIPAPTLAGTAWRTVALLMPVALLNYLDRQMMATMQASVMRSIPDIGTDANWGFMLGLFKWVYAAVSLFGGYVADRFSRRLTVCASLFVWSGVTWWTGQVTTYSELLWARSLMGFSEAFYIPAALALIADYHTGGTRSRAVGLHQLAIYCGQILGGFGGYVAQTNAVRVEFVGRAGEVTGFALDLGWRAAFTACGVVGMLYAVPLVLLLRDAPRHDREADRLSTPRPSPAAAARALAANRSFLLLVLYFTLPAMAGWVVRDWMPSILKRQFGLGEGKAGVSATLYWQLAAILGAVAGGFLADRWMRATHRGRVYTSAIGMSLIVPAIFGIGNAGTLGVAVAFLILFGLGWGLFDCNNMPILAQLVRPELRATGYGVMNFVSIGCGGLADWGFGKLRDSDVPLNVSFGGFALLAVASVALVLLIRPKPDAR
jgi:MFS family permease